MILVVPAPERGNEAVGGGDFPIRGHRHVDQDEGRGC